MEYVTANLLFVILVSTLMEVHVDLSLKIAKLLTTTLKIAPNASQDLP